MLVSDTLNQIHACRPANPCLPLVVLTLVADASVSRSQLRLLQGDGRRRVPGSERSHPTGLHGEQEGAFCTPAKPSALTWYPFMLFSLFSLNVCPHKSLLVTVDALSLRSLISF